jgi:hypothetical protein
MKHPNFKVLTLLLLLVISNSCEKDSQREYADEGKCIVKAQDWFYSKTSGSLPLPNSSNLKSNNKLQLIPDWNNAKNIQHKNHKVIEIPLLGIEGEFTEDICSDYRIDKPNSDSETHTHLVVQYDSQNQMAQGFIMCIIPNDDYIISDAMKSSINYYSIPSNFSGSIVYYNLDGAFNNAWKYEQGKLQDGYILEKQLSSHVKGIAIFEIRRCNNIYTGVGNEMEFQYQYCWSTYQHVEVIDGFEAPGPEDEPKDDDNNISIPLGYLGGGTGSTGNTGGNPPKKLKPLDVPCNQISQIAAHSSFVSKMNSLKSNTRLVVETAYLMRGKESGLDEFNYEYQQSDMDTPGLINLDLRNGSIDGYIHSHRYGDSPIFSINDILAIYLAYKAGKINDLRTFTAGVVTADGTTYLVNINDKEAFIKFGDKYFKSESDMAKMENDYISIFNGEQPFFQKSALMLALSDAGIYLFEGDVDNFKTWNRQVIGSGGVPIKSNCND